MKRKIGIILLLLLTFTSVSSIFILSLNHDENSSLGVNTFDTYLTIDDFAWNVGTAERNNTYLDGFTIGTGYTYDIDS